MTAPLSSVQFRIGQTLLQARAGEDSELASVVREQGDVLVNQLTGLMKLVRVHDAANQAFEVPVREFQRTLANLIETLGPCQVVCLDQQVYVNEVRIRLEHRGDVAAWLDSTLERQGIGGLTLHAPLEPWAIRIVAQALSAPGAEAARTRQQIQADFDAEGVLGVELVPPMQWRTGLEGPTGGQAEGFEAVYRLCLSRVALAWMALAAGRRPHPAPVRRAVLDLVDFCRGGREIMSVLSDQAMNPILAHAVHVAAISVLVGVDLGLDDGVLADLGVAAVFHDVGALTTPGRPGADRAQHTLAGVETLLGQRGFHPGKIRRLLATVQHHDRHDERGRYGQRASLFARIIRIADDYDTFTRVRGFKPLVTPPAALEYMVGASGPHYDPVLLQILVNRLGRFPPGTLLELDDGAWGQVVSGVRLPRWFARPLVRIIRNGDGTRPEEHTVRDLALTGAIRRVVHPD